MLAESDISSLLFLKGLGAEIFSQFFQSFLLREALYVSTSPQKRFGIWYVNIHLLSIPLIVAFFKPHTSICNAANALFGEQSQWQYENLKICMSIFSLVWGSNNV
jgi:hypothetical protein